MTATLQNDSGNAFLEILVALIIIAAALGVLFEVIADGAVRARQAEAKRSALVVAQSELAAAGIAYPLDGGPVNGVEGPFTWWVDFAPYGRSTSGAGRLWAVRVQVSLSSGGPVLVDMRSLRLASAR
jgi:type II secretory pathway pseudopilin PulG